MKTRKAIDIIDREGQSARADSDLPVCVQHRDGWCVRASHSEEYADNIRTRCGHVVVMAWGIERREPTCEDCLQIASRGLREKLHG